MRAARRRAVRRRSDSMSSTLPCRWTETSPVNPFNREEGINNPSLVCLSLLKIFPSSVVLRIAESPVEYNVLDHPRPFLAALAHRFGGLPGVP